MNVRLIGHQTKSRSRPDVVVTGQYDDQFNSAHVLQVHNLIPDYVSSTVGESIVYTTGRRNLYAKANYCLHTKERFQYPGSAAWFTTMPSPSGWTADYRSAHAFACTAKTSVIGAAQSALTNIGSSVLGLNGQAFINSAFDKLRPDLTNANIPNFLLDIEDVRNLSKLWKSQVSIAKNVAGLHLNYKFGWKPTIGDIRDSINGVIGLQSKLAAFRNSVGKTIQSSIILPTGLPTSASGTLSWPSGSHQVSWSASCTRKCQAFIVYKPQFPPELNTMLEVLGGYLDSLGFELNPRIIWDAIPFSFVIDWFFGVGNWLNRFKIDTVELPIQLVDGFLQYKETLNIEWTWLRANDGTYTSRPRSDVASYERTLFHRVPIYPDFASLTGLGWKLPTLNQALLGVSLATILRK